MSRYKNNSPLGKMKGVLIAIVIAAVFVFAMLKELGPVLPGSMRALSRTFQSANPIKVILIIAVAASAVYAVFMLVYMGGSWASGSTRGVRGKAHIPALCFFALNIPYMALIAAYPGHLLVRLAMGAIDFTIIPRSYSVIGALICAIILGVADYRVSSRTKHWGALLVTHAVFAVIASFWLYAIAVLLFIAIAAPVFGFIERFAKAYKRVYDAMPSAISYDRRREITDDIMHSSLGFLVMFHLINEKEI